MPLFIHSMSARRADHGLRRPGQDARLHLRRRLRDGIARHRGARRGPVANQTINLAYGQGNTLVHAAELIAAELGVEPEMTIAPSLLGEVTRYVADLRKAVTCSATTRRCRSTRASPARSPGSRASRSTPEENVPGTADHEGDSDDVEHGWKTVPVLASSPSSARPRRARRPSPRRSRSVPAELGLGRLMYYRGLPILTNQDAGARLVGIWPLDRQGTVGEFQVLAHEAIDEIVAAGRTAVVVGGSGLWFQAALTDVRLPADVPRTPGRAGLLTTAVAPRPRTACCRPRSPRRGAGAPERPQARRARPRALAGGRDAGARAAAALERRAAAADPRRRPRGSARDAGGTDSASVRQRCSTRASRTRCARPATSPQVLGLDAVRTLPRAEAIAELERGTLRFAAYQRKWMRRIPGIVMIDADRPAGEVADAILEVARTR